MYERGPRVFFHPSAKPLERWNGMRCVCLWLWLSLWARWVKMGDMTTKPSTWWKWNFWSRVLWLGERCSDAKHDLPSQSHSPILYHIYSHSLARSHHLQLFRSPLVRALFYFCKNLKTGLSAYLLSMLSILSYAFFIFLFFVFFFYFFFARRSSCLSYGTTSPVPT